MKSWTSKTTPLSNRACWKQAIQSKQPSPSNPIKIPVTLHPRQQEFVDDDRLEILLGGAAGGGKTVAQLASALKYAHVPGYSALLIRRAYSDLEMAGAFIPLSQAWLRGTGASYNQSAKRWMFPSGATLTFGYLDHDRDLDRYQGAEFQFIGIDECTQIPEHRIRYLFSRLRKPNDLNAPLRFRLTSNPGGVSHDFIKRRFLLEPDTDDRRFIPARLTDNPSLDQATYLENLMHLDPLTRKRLLDGDWDAIAQGGMFERGWFHVIELHQVPDGVHWVRYWDRAATEPKPGTDPDYTAGALVGLHKGVWYVKHMHHFRASSEGNERRIRETASADGERVEIYMEQEPGSAGVDVINHYARHVVVGHTFKGHRPTGSKAERAAPLASAAEQGNVKLVSGTWVDAFLDEASAFPLSPHKDMVDAVSGAMAVINAQPTFVFRPLRVLDL